MITLSGGDLGGTVVDAADWQIGDVREFDGGYQYRLDSHTQATFVGMKG